MTLTEMLFKGEPVKSIFTCKILTNLTKIDENSSAFQNKDFIREDILITATVNQIYFGKVDTNIITIKTSGFKYFVHDFEFEVGKTYLIFSPTDKKIFNITSFYKWTKQVTDIPDSSNEIKILKQFADIFKYKKTGQFTFKNSNGIIVATGEYDNGKAVNVWKHYYDNGIIKAEYDLKNNITTQYSTNGIIKEETIISNDANITETFTSQGVLSEKNIYIKHDTVESRQEIKYYENSDKIKSVKTTITPISPYEEYYENGDLKLKGQYLNHEKVGMWKEYDEKEKIVQKTGYSNDESLKKIPALKYIPDTALRKELIKMKFTTHDSLDLNKIKKPVFFISGRKKY